MKISSKIMKAAHKLTKEIKAKYPEVDYRAQLGICIKFLLKKGEIKMINEMFEKVIVVLKNLDEVKFNPIFSKEVMEDANKMFNDGWDKLEDGIVIATRGNSVAIKKGDIIIKQEMESFRINMGKLTGDVKEISKEIKVTEDKKEGFLAQAIITKYYTIRRA